MIVEDVFSLVTYALINTTVLNQGNHCIAAIPSDPHRSPIDFGNVSIKYNDDNCRQMEMRLQERITEIMQNFRV